MSASIILTGCLGGLGTAINSVLTESGYRVIGIDQDPGTSQDYIAFDLRRLASEDGHNELSKLLEKKLGKDSLLALINNAAVQKLDEFHQFQDSDFMDSMLINAIAPAFLSRLLLARLSESNGQIINIGSIHGEQTKPGFFSYSTSKSALAGVTRALAVEIGAKVRVNMIVPAAIETDMLRAGLSDSQIRSLKSLHPTGCIGEPYNVANFVASLISQNNRFINGAFIEIDGGISRRLYDIE